jgi:ent-copalyl diphosphate synthase
VSQLELFVITISVPNVYPVDLFEHIWAVDRLERLGISRYFQREIKQCMDYVNRFLSLWPLFSALLFLLLNIYHGTISFSEDVMMNSLRLIFSFCRHWTEEGICWARNSHLKDVDDTAMAFRLLRLHGYNVSPSTKKLIL